jgi:pimeloyl-ACP methyl ester carboxylesterase
VPAGETAAIKEVLARPESLAAALGYRALRLSPPAVLKKPIGVPSAVFSGADDPYFRLGDYERARRCYSGPHENIHMPGGHFLHREHPERFTAELLRVLTAVVPP